MLKHWMIRVIFILTDYLQEKVEISQLRPYCLSQIPIIDIYNILVTHTLFLKLYSIHYNFFRFSKYSQFSAPERSLSYKMTDCQVVICLRGNCWPNFSCCVMTSAAESAGLRGSAVWDLFCDLLECTVVYSEFIHIGSIIRLVFNHFKDIIVQIKCKYVSS